MPYLVKVGLFKDNKGKIGSRGWHIWRRGMTVQWEFGPIEILHRRPKRFRWAAIPTRDEPLKFSTISEAKKELTRRMKSKLQPDRDGAYERLPAGIRILEPLQRRVSAE